MKMESLVYSLLVIILSVPDMAQCERVRRQVSGRESCSDISDCRKVGSFLGKIAFRCGKGSSMKMCLKLPTLVRETTTNTAVFTSRKTTPTASTTPTAVTSTNRFTTTWEDMLGNEVEFAGGADDPVDSTIKKVHACADIVFILDFSCSVPRKDRLMGIQLIKKLSERLILNTNDGAWFGVVPFSRKVIRENVWKFPPANKKDQTLRSFLDSYDVRQPCKTRIRFAFQFANETFFKKPNDRNDDEYKDLVIVVGDGRTSPRPRIEKKNGRDYANALKTDDGIQIAWVKTNTLLVNRKKNLANSKALEKAITEGDAEIADIVPDPSLRFSLNEEIEHLDDPQAVGGILEFIRDNFKCNL
ncbi:unnamed protein product [Owenia fusiformis]|uniref:Uncharacterized protein n=1 Tax=Owenia fusiformis TaxID=6347 RepID=A0A8J1XP50_OWEFU|nr:unnamed protein product [Owenia fusiformis]